MLRIMIAPDSFKGSLTAKEAVEAMANGVHKVNANYQVIKFPIADGGEGTVECILDAVGGRLITKDVLDPLGRTVSASFGILKDGTAVIEVASASGLCLVSEEEKNPLIATSYGTGELILAALEEECSDIFIGLGGSATNDAGAGIIQALGGRLLDRDGKELGLGGQELNKLAKIDLSQLDQRLNKTNILLGCDVDNPLFGTNGASVVYGPQKGATQKMVVTLDSALMNFANITKKMGKDVAETPGAGAAGGIGAGLLFLGASTTSGLEKILELTGMEEVLRKGVDLIFTGEGEFNSQSLHGKVPVGVARLAKKYQVPVIVLTGSINGAVDNAYKEGIYAILSITPKPMKLDDALANASIYLQDATTEIMRVYETGFMQAIEG